MCIRDRADVRSNGDARWDGMGPRDSRPVSLQENLIQKYRVYRMFEVFYPIGLPSASRISMAPRFSFLSSGSILARSPTAMTTWLPGTRYFFAIASAWSVVTAFTCAAYFV